MALWYFRHDDELMIDIDDPEKPTRRDGGAWIEEFFRLRLQAAMEAEILHVREVWLVPSTTKRHKHIIVRLWSGGEPSQLACLVWQMHLGSDLYRGKADLMRLSRHVMFPSLLIEKARIIDPTTGEPFYRKPDAVCECLEKHITEEQFALGDKGCAVWRQFRGIAPWELWGPPPKPQTRVRLRDGKVPLEYITAQIPKVRGKHPDDPEVRKSWIMSRQIASGGKEVRR